MGHSSGSSSTLKKPFQTFKSCTPIQRTTRTGRVKFLLPFLLLISLAALCNAGDGDAAVAKTAAIKNIQKSLTARILKRLKREEPADADDDGSEDGDDAEDEGDEEAEVELPAATVAEDLHNAGDNEGFTVTVEEPEHAGDVERSLARYYSYMRCYQKRTYRCRYGRCYRRTTRRCYRRY